MDVVLKGEGRRRGADVYPARHFRGDAYAGMPSSGRLPGRVPVPAGAPRPPSACRPRSSLVGAALDLPPAQNDGGRRTVLEVGRNQKPSLQGAGALVCSHSGCKAAERESKGAAGNFRPGPGLLLRTQAPQREGRQHFAEQGGFSHLKRDSAAPLVRTSESNAPPRQRAAQAGPGSHFKEGQCGVLRTEAAPREPRAGAHSAAAARCHFANGSMVMRTGAGLEHYLRVSG